MIVKKVMVKNPSGLHVRPAGKLAKAAEQCSSTVEILKDNSIINCKSLLNILSGAIRCGDEIILRCTGKMEKEDMERMLDVIEHDLES